MSRERLDVALDHEESTIIGRNVVGRLAASGGYEAALEEHAWSLRRKAPAGSDTHRHHLVAAAIEDLASGVRPDRLASPRDRDLPLSSRPGEGLHVHFVASRLVGDVGEPAAVGRESSPALV